MNYSSASAFSSIIKQVPCLVDNCQIFTMDDLTAQLLGNPNQRNQLVRLPKPRIAIWGDHLPPPSDMTCVSYGSKIYFFGDFRGPKYVWDVYAYDTTSSAAGLRLEKVCSMGEGKKQPLVIGSVNGKFYYHRLRDWACSAASSSGPKISPLA